MDYSFLVIDLLGLFTVVGIGYYASRILIQMKAGLLEQSWRYLVAGAYVLLGAVVIFLIQQFVSSPLAIAVTTHLSAVLLVIGGIYVLLGFRSHYIVFSPKHPKKRMNDLIEK